MTFAADVQKFIRKTKIRQDVVLRKLAFDALAGFLKMSPVDEGRFRGNWQVSLNQPDLSASSPNDKTSPATFGRGAGEISAAKVGTSIFITNNVPYAGALERGHSQQASNGVLHVTVARIKSGLAATVRGLS